MMLLSFFLGATLGGSVGILIMALLRASEG